MKLFADIPAVKVRVASHARFHLHSDGGHRIVEDGCTTRYIPESPDSTMTASGIDIGIRFHWQRRVAMTLPGEVTVVRRDDGTADLFNTLDAETYLLSVVSSEMNPSAPFEFLKVHTIISRSWLAGKLLGRHPAGTSGKVFEPHRIVSWEDTSDHSGFDVCGDDHCQRYQGIDRVNEVTRRAVGETAGCVICDSAGNPADARFSKCCGGRTELFSTCWQDTDFDYLTSTDDPWCDLSLLTDNERDDILNSILMSYDRTTTDFHDWTAVVRADDVQAAMTRRYGINSGRIIDIRVSERGASGRAKSIEITAENGTFTVGKELEIRRLLSDKCLYSSNFEISKAADGNFILTGHGWGHGVGLCQIGAAVMALKGKKHDEILHFYYPTVTIRKIY